jgi:RimJ/RimL family protein N-acetyltransferase
MLIGRSVRLRALERADLPDVVRWFNDPEVRALVARSSPLSLAEEERWFEAQLKSTEGVVFAIETPPAKMAPARSIGCCGLQRIDWRNRHADLGIMIGAVADRGRGYGSDAVRCLVDHALLDLGLHRVELEVYADNLPARRCYERLGFVLEGVRRQATWKGGTFKDNVVMAVLATEWNGRQGRSLPPSPPAPPSPRPAARGRRTVGERRR